MSDFERRQIEAMLEEIHNNDTERFNVRIGALSMFREELSLSAQFLEDIVDWFEEAGGLTRADIEKHGCVFIERLMDPLA